MPKLAKTVFCDSATRMDMLRRVENPVFQSYDINTRIRIGIGVSRKPKWGWHIESDARHAPKNVKKTVFFVRWQRFLRYQKKEVNAPHRFGKWHNARHNHRAMGRMMSHGE